MGTKVGELRESLMDAIEMVKAGKLDAEDAGAISKLAHQITQSLKVTADIISKGLDRDVLLGSLALGNENPPPKTIEAELPLKKIGSKAST